MGGLELNNNFFSGETEAGHRFRFMRARSRQEIAL